MGRKNVNVKNGKSAPQNVAVEAPEAEVVAPAEDAPIGTPLKDELVKSLAFLPEGSESAAFLLEHFEKLELEHAKLRRTNADQEIKCKRIPLYEKKIQYADGVINKLELAKARLELLCRELQKQNREATEAHLEKCKLMEKSREEIISQFQSSLKEIQDSVDSGRQNHTKLFEENQNLITRMAAISENYEAKFELLNEEYSAKEKLNENVINTKEMEKKLLQAKLEAEGIMRQKLEQEKKQLQILLGDLEKRLNTSVDAEKILRTQILEYSGRYGELTKSLTSSNEAFDKFKKQMEKMNGNLIKVERDSRKWKEKFDEASKNVLVLVMEKKELEASIEKKHRQMEQLKQLCRQLRNTDGNSAELPGSDSTPEEAAEEPKSEENVSSTA
ncbi:hypothetical protein L596_008234 [Steinernema carpocapsae]|uniref:Uncharacterized protein n=1 Tax=Steinernema carpocapsae TaxID=34508 RepID=A0A4U5PBU8_STECR|nr:hypothetical protein L596_008234 [Steinernema carpocapsae]